MELHHPGVVEALVAVRDGLYGIGPFARMATEFPAELTLREVALACAGGVRAHRAERAVHGHGEEPYSQFGSGNSTAQENLFFDNFTFVDFHAVGTIDSPQFFPRYEERRSDAEEAHRPGVEDERRDRRGVRPARGGELLVDGAEEPGSGSGAGGDLHPRSREHEVRRDERRRLPGAHGHRDARHRRGEPRRRRRPGVARGGEGSVQAAEIEGLGIGIVDGRALDQDGDGKLDSGVDYWTAYVFHTRDMVRQTGVDHVPGDPRAEVVRWREDVEVRRELRR